MGEYRGIRWVTVAAVLTITTVRCEAPMDAEEVDCLEALERLSDCCAGYQVNRQACVHQTSRDSCGVESTTEPRYSSEFTRCIRRKSCEQLNAEKVCADAATSWRPTCR